MSHIILSVENDFQSDTRRFTVRNVGDTDFTIEDFGMVVPSEVLPRLWPLRGLIPARMMKRILHRKADTIYLVPMWDRLHDIDLPVTLSPGQRVSFHVRRSMKPRKLATAFYAVRDERQKIHILCV